MEPMERAKRRIKVTEAGCWEWCGATADGYGHFGMGRKTVYVHRWIYEQMVGPIPAGMQLDHLCRNRLCANPSHLEPVDNQTNQDRGERATKKYCNRGHPLFGDNLLMRKIPEWRYNSGSRMWRQCRECKRLNDVKRNAARRKRVA